MRESQIGSHDDFELDLNALLHPASAFDHPRDVVNDPDLTRHEKRAILSSWASDACAVASAPGLRQPPGARMPVTFDEIIDAVKRLNEEQKSQLEGLWLAVLSARDGQDGYLTARAGRRYFCDISAGSLSASSVGT